VCCIAGFGRNCAGIGAWWRKAYQIRRFSQLPGNRPDLNANLEKSELIVAVEIPDAPFTKHIHYLKVRDRASYAFALVSVAAALEIEENSIKTVRLTMGGVAHKPWRMYEAEKILQVKPFQKPYSGKLLRRQ
jgi:xanthine dehydrogenase YagS FAD-binding subunit